MWPYHPDLLARAVPRYTSYPTAADFDDDVPADMAAEALAGIEDGTPFSLYVHIPYCQDICWYCGCNTGRANRPERLAAYVEALQAEVRTVSRLLAGRGRLGRIAFGGGSPNAISPVDFTRLVSEILLTFEADTADLSVEIDPRGFGPGWAMTLGVVGTQRVSLGVQTFDPAVQQRIGRIQPHEMIAQAVEQLRARDVVSINFDLMYGLPGQDREALHATIDATLDLAPERIALFGYAHMPAMIARQRMIDAQDLPDGAERFDMAALGHARLQAAGYVPIGFDHFARANDPLAQAAQSGRLRRNFQGFTDDPCNIVIGVGASAISLFPDRIVQNEKGAARWRALASDGQLAASRGIRLAPDDGLRAAIIEDLLCGRVADITGMPVEIRERLQPFVRRRLAYLNGPCLSVSEAGRPYARAIAACFDAYRGQSSARFSRAI